MRRQLVRAAAIVRRQEYREAAKERARQAHATDADSSTSDNPVQGRALKMGKKHSSSVGKLLNRSTSASAAEMNLQKQLIRMRRGSSGHLSAVPETGTSSTACANSPSSAANSGAGVSTSLVSESSIRDLTAAVARQAEAMQAMTKDVAQLRAALLPKGDPRDSKLQA